MDVSHAGRSLETMCRWLDQLPAAAFLTQAQDGRVLHANSRACRLSGGDPGLARGLSDLVRGVAADGRALPAADDPIAKALQDGSALEDTSAVIKTTRGWTPITVAIEPVIDPVDELVGSILVCHAMPAPSDAAGSTLDRSDRRRAEAALVEADRRKDEFLTVLAHELRGPLAPILTAARLLQMKGPPDPQLTKARETIIRQTMQLTRLVDDLLDIGRISAGKVLLDKKPIELNAIVRQAVETCAPAIDGRRHRLNLVLSDRPIHLDADGTRLVQITCNLLNNAAKYMREGGRIDVSTALEGGQAFIRVRDEGVGLAPEMLDPIFERFVQVGTSRHRAEGGLGIGLSLVKALVELHGGSVQASSEGIGKGSEFIVRLPVTPPPGAC